MRIGILGPLQIEDGDGPRGTKQRLLLSLLVLHAPRTASLDRLIDAIWPDELPSDSLGALRTQVSRLRSGPVGAALRSDPHGYGLDTDRVRIDAADFRRALRSARAAGSPGVEVAELDRALALWRGRAYEEFAKHPAFIGESRSLEELRVGAVEARIACLIALDRTAEARAEVEQLIYADPFSERPQALLMQALHRSGRSHEALAAFQRYRRSLLDELGLDPSPRLRELHTAILRHEPLRGEAVARTAVLAGPGGPTEPASPDRSALPHDSAVPDDSATPHDSAVPDGSTPRTDVANPSPPPPARHPTAVDPFLPRPRWSPTGLRNRRVRPAPDQGCKLAEPPGVRLGEPRVAASVEGAGSRADPGPIR